VIIIIFLKGQLRSSNLQTVRSAYQPAVLFSQNKPVTSNQPAILFFSQNTPTSAISHRPTETVTLAVTPMSTVILPFFQLHEFG
jgi:hypothetical protein